MDFRDAPRLDRNLPYNFKFLTPGIVNTQDILVEFVWIYVSTDRIPMGNRLDREMKPSYNLISIILSLEKPNEEITRRESPETYIII